MGCFISLPFSAIGTVLRGLRNRSVASLDPPQLLIRLLASLVPGVRQDGVGRDIGGEEELQREAGGVEEPHAGVWRRRVLAGGDFDGRLW